MVEVEKHGFDTSAFLANAGLGRTIIQFARSDAFFSQGDSADSIFYLQKDAQKSQLFPRVGRKPSSHSWPLVTLWEKRHSRRCQGCAWLRPLPLPTARLSESAGER